MRISAALVIYSAPKRPHTVASTMPKRCVAAGCDKGSDGKFSLFTFPKNPERRAQWSREVAKTRSDWTGPSDHSVLCSLHFTKDSFEASIALTTELGLPAKRRKLKDSAVPSLFPKAADVRAGSMEWATESIHYPTLQATDGSGTCVSQHRSVTIKRKRAQVGYIHILQMGMLHCVIGMTKHI